MAVINHVKREINAKLVLFGPPDCGKEALFRYIHQRIKPSLCGPLKSMAAGQDSLLFFDYVPFESSSLNGYRIRFHLYTLPGPVSNPGTWKMTLKGVDGIVFLTGDREASRTAGAEGVRSLQAMLGAYGRDLLQLPRLWLADPEEAGRSDEVTACFDAGHRMVCNRATGDSVLSALAQLSHEVLQHLKRESMPVADTVSPQPDGEIRQTAAESGAKRQPEISAAEQQALIRLEDGAVVQVPLTVTLGDRHQRYMLRIALELTSDQE